ncbi:hypothetical protein FA15DRAFT_701769 [Coprinopsis marcescibilis]|uniref:Uncharacterized protein n=1 Tax=Coprinopsis marcescibilis TaxID=230819 RepID=A0A5C3L4A5_COPMA|nr:hypothetical protein FA15DRAFT_701769 [Coprinopsis marcescibilis]
MSLLDEQLLSTTDAFLQALAVNASSQCLLSFFSTTNPVVVQHAPAGCNHAHTSRLTGLNAVRSYFDLVTTHWTRSSVQTHSRPRANSSKRRTVISASVTWMWRQSGRQWTEDFICTLDFDENFKIVSFIIQTESPPETCLMSAKDVESSSSTLSSSTIHTHQHRPHAITRPHPSDLIDSDFISPRITSLHCHMPSANRIVSSGSDKIRLDNVMPYANEPRSAMFSRQVCSASGFQDITYPQILHDKFYFHNDQYPFVQTPS